MHESGELMKVLESPDCRRERSSSEAAGDSDLESFRGVCSVASGGSSGIRTGRPFASKDSQQGLAGGSL